MNSNETTVSENTSINYEEAMDMLLKSLEKSEVFQLRRHITKMVLSVGGVLFVLNIFIMAHVISLIKDTSAIKEEIHGLQQMIIQQEETQPIVEEPIVEETVEDENADNTDNINEIAQEYFTVMTELMARQECTEDWYLDYKETVSEYSDIIGAPDRLEDVFTPDELTLFQKCVETETHGGTFWSKVNVANVILNRVNNPNKWANNITGVITAPNQFAYSNGAITESTKLAIEYAYQFADTTQGAEFFNTGDPNTGHNATRIYVFTDDIGHSFFKDATNYSSNDNDDDSVG